MNKQHKTVLQGLLIGYAEDGPRDLFTKRDVLAFADDDLKTVEEAIAEWEAAGAVRSLASVRVASPETFIIQVDLKRLTELYYEDCAKIRAEMYRNMDPKEGTEFLRRLDGPKLRAETLQYLDPEERAQALKRLEEQ